MQPNNSKVGRKRGRKWPIATSTSSKNTPTMIARRRIFRSTKGFPPGGPACGVRPVSLNGRRRFLSLTMLEIENLTKHFGGVTAVAGLSLSVGRGEVLGFLGPNGAGKTTT